MRLIISFLVGLALGIAFVVAALWPLVRSLEEAYK